MRVENCATCVGDHLAATKRFNTVTEVAALADIVTYPSRFALDLCETSGLAPGKGVVWQNGIHLPKASFFEAQAERRAEKPGHVFGFLGGPSQIKGWPIIKRAFKDLGDEDVEVLLVDGSADGTWWAKDATEGLPGNWQIVPRFEQAEMDSFYARVDTLLFMSQWKETFGLAIREALARGIRVIQTDSGGTTEHPAAESSRLIPIGEDAALLTAQLSEALDVPNQRPVPGIQDFGGQAEDFCALCEKLGVQMGPQNVVAFRQPA